MEDLAFCQDNFAIYGYAFVNFANHEEASKAGLGTTRELGSTRDNSGNSGQLWHERHSRVLSAGAALPGFRIV